MRRWTLLLAITAGAAFQQLQQWSPQLVRRVHVRFPDGLEGGYRCAAEAGSEQQHRGRPDG